MRSIIHHFTFNWVVLLVIIVWLLAMYLCERYLPSLSDPVFYLGLIAWVVWLIRGPKNSKDIE